MVQPLFIFDLKIATGVITMVMGVKDMGNLPALAAVVANSGSTTAGRRRRKRPLPRHALDRRSFVSENRQLMDFQRAHGRLP